MRDIRWLLAFARPATGILAVSVAARILGHAALAATLALPAWALGTTATGPAATKTGGPAELSRVLLCLVALVLLAAVLRYLEQLTGHLAAFRLLGELRIWVMERLIPQAPAVVDTRGSARILAVAVHDVDRIEVFFAHTIAPAISALVVPGAAVAAAGMLAGSPTATALALVLLLGWVVPVIGGRTSRADARSVGVLREDIAQHTADSLRLREVLDQAGTADARLASLQRLDEHLGERLTARARHAGRRSGASTARVWGGTLLVLLTALASHSGSAAEALPGILAASALVPGTMSGLDTLERLASSLPAGLAATRRVRELAEARPEVAEPTAPRTAPPLQNPAAALEHVHYGYPDRQVPVLEDVHLHLDRGGMVGVVGPSGSGKSTLARLLQRHVDPLAGSVEVRGIDTRQLGSEQVQRLVVVADQDPFLREGTIAQNLRLAAEDASEQEMREALAAACTDLALDRQVGPRGSALSGGERQRVALARTLLRAARSPGGMSGAVLILDEATSHQDPLTQERVMRSVESLGASLLVIAHREETLERAGRIVRVEQGRVAEVTRGGRTAAS
jgi:ATP-binding cassette subfamily C protein CydC